MRPAMVEASRAYRSVLRQQLLGRRRQDTGGQNFRHGEHGKGVSVKISGGRGGSSTSSYSTPKKALLMRSETNKDGKEKTGCIDAVLVSFVHCFLRRLTVTSDHFMIGERSRSHIWLVDLAGSEHLAKTEVEGQRLKEAKFINKSLPAPGDVIAALASKNIHIPYRNSKLTHVLQSSLGGDCKTLMFVQIRVQALQIRERETLCSLTSARMGKQGIYGHVAKRRLPSLPFPQHSSFPTAASS